MRPSITPSLKGRDNEDRVWHLRATAGVALAILITLGSCAKPVEDVTASPNVLFIMTDQHNANALGCAGDDVIQTPALDGLAASGIRFTNAFCNTPQCAPSRYTIWTGLYARSHGLRANRVPEDPYHTTIAELLQARGWETASIGKHHMSRSPREHGFQHVIDSEDFESFRKAGNHPDWNQAGSWFGFVNEAMKGHVGRSDVPNELHRDGYFANQAIEFMRQPRKQPFCMWLSFFGPHTPIAPSSPWADMYAAEEMSLPPNSGRKAFDGFGNLADSQALFEEFTPHRHRRVAALYAGFVSQLDDNIGRVLSELEQLGIADNTIVVYTSDHGDMRGAYGLWGKQLLLFDPILKVPLIIRAPGLGNASKTSSELVELVDLAPTLLELTGTPIPSHMQGRSLQPLISGENPPWRSFAFGEIGYPAVRNGRSYMARSQTSKFIWSENSGSPMEFFFDLNGDPWEENNLIRDQASAQELAQHRTALEDWKQRTPKAPMVAPGAGD